VPSEPYDPANDPGSELYGMPGYTDKEVDWRLHVLVEAGYPTVSAAAIAVKKDIDLHRAVALVKEKGCPVELAADILL